MCENYLSRDLADVIHKFRVEFSIHQNSGQHCQANSRVFVHESIAHEFTQKLVDLLQSRKIGDSVDKTVFQGPQGDKLQRDRIVHLLEQGSKDGKVLCGGHAMTVNGKVGRVNHILPSITG